MFKKILIFIIILLALLGAYFVYNYFARQITKKPNEQIQSLEQIPAETDFKGPTGPPSIKGPTGPSPQN